MNKTMIYLGASVGGVIGSYIGSWLDHGNFLGVWSILAGAVGGLAGVYVAYKIQQNM